MSHVKIYRVLLIIWCAVRRLTLQCDELCHEMLKYTTVATCYGVPLKCMLLCDMLCCKTVNYIVDCYVLYFTVGCWSVMCWCVRQWALLLCT